MRPTHPNHVCAIDFVHDKLADNTLIRLSTVIVVFTRVALVVEVGLRLRIEDFARVLNRLWRVDELTHVTV